MDSGIKGNNAGAALPVRQAAYAPYQPTHASQFAPSWSEAPYQSDPNMRSGVQESSANGYEAWGQNAHDTNSLQHRRAASTTQATYSTSQANPGLDLMDENMRLMLKIESLNQDAVAKQRALDDILAELMETQDELGEMKTYLIRKEAECAALRSNGASLGSPIHSAMMGFQATSGTATPDMQQKLNSLEAQLSVKEELLKAKDNDLASMETRWQDRLQQRESQLSDRQGQLQSELAVERAARQQSIQEIHRLEESVVSHEQENQRLASLLQDAKTAGLAAVESESHARKVEEALKNMQFFKDNSERVSRQLAESKERNQTLARDLGAKERELDDQRSLNLALKMQSGSA